MTAVHGVTLHAHVHTCLQGEDDDAIAAPELDKYMQATRDQLTDAEVAQVRNIRLSDCTSAHAQRST